MTKKLVKITIIIIIAVLLIVLGYLIYIRFYRVSGSTGPVSVADTPTGKNPSAQTVANSQEVKTIEFQPAPAVTQTPVKTPVEAKKDDLLRLASSFGERFGSFSNQSNFTNITDLEIFMSQGMKNWALGYIESQRKKAGAVAPYYGIITKAIASEMQAYDDDQGLAAVLIMTRRREAIGAVDNTSNVFSQNLTINFIKEQGAWKVDKATWSAH